MHDDSDDALMRRAGGGDKAAFAVLTRRHLARATAIAQRIVANRSDTEEIVQETFLRCWQKAPDWLPANDRLPGSAAAGGTNGIAGVNGAAPAAARAQFATWLYRVLVNLCLDRRRRPQPVALEEAAEVADEGADGFDVAARGETSRRVAEALAALPDRQRAALVLCYFEGLGNIEAAAALEISIGALESLLVRGRRALKDSLADLAGDRAAGGKAAGTNNATADRAAPGKTN